MSAQECFICMIEGNLIKNSHCKCNFYYHQSCWDKYNGFSSEVKCPLCRHIIKANEEVLLNISIEDDNEHSVKRRELQTVFLAIILGGIGYGVYHIIQNFY